MHRLDVETNARRKDEGKKRRRVDDEKTLLFARHFDPVVDDECVYVLCFEGRRSRKRESRLFALHDFTIGESIEFQKMASFALFSLSPCFAVSPHPMLIIHSCDNLKPGFRITRTSSSRSLNCSSVLL